MRGERARERKVVTVDEIREQEAMGSKMISKAQQERGKSKRGTAREAQQQQERHSKRGTATARGTQQREARKQERHSTHPCTLLRFWFPNVKPSWILSNQIAS
jgi:hypothetical protein